MELKSQDGAPLFRQVARALEDGILSGAFPEGSQVPSTNETALACRVNPATVLKGMNLLKDRGLLEKRRGMGLFVAPGARAALLAERRARFERTALRALVEEARKLGLDRADLCRMIEKEEDHEH